MPSFSPNFRLPPLSPNPAGRRNGGVVSSRLERVSIKHV